MRRTLVCLALTAILLVRPGDARAQGTLQATDVQVGYTYGEELTISARLEAPAAIQSGVLFLEPDGVAQPSSLPLSLGADGLAQVTTQVQPGLLRPFVRITFWFQAELADGESLLSPTYDFTYDDNRHTWQTLDGGLLRVHWYDGDAAFGQAALQAARSGLQAVQAILPAPSQAPTDIYIYASAADVQETLGLGGLSWVGGHASPDLGVVLVSIAPGADQADGFANQIPHELAHVLLYRLTGSSYDILPTWLREGLAELAEQAPNGDNARMLAQAAANGALLPIGDLCGLFPQDTSGASLAYAESASFTRFLSDAYGSGPLQALIQAYAGGKDCQAGPQQAMGESLSQLEAHWKQTVLGVQQNGLAFSDLLPYLVVLLAILVGPAIYILVALRRRSVHDHDGPK